jgi:hypothetical protein
MSKFCKDCKYLKSDTWCTHPNNGVNLVHGNGNLRFASVNRQSNTVLYNGVVCGDNGDWFEEKPVVEKKWWEFWK